MSGFARRRVSTKRRSSEHRSTREPKAVVCTLGTLNTDCGEAFSLLRFFVAVGQRNEVPPRTVANSDKKYSQYTTRANVRSSNPAPTPTTEHDEPRAPKLRPSANENTLAYAAPPPRPPPSASAYPQAPTSPHAVQKSQPSLRIIALAPQVGHLRPGIGSKACGLAASALSSTTPAMSSSPAAENPSAPAARALS